MPTLYVENIPSDLYDALRLRAKAEGRSISAEVIKLLSENIPTEAQLATRRRLFDFARKIREGQPPLHPEQVESADEMLRGDRAR